MVNKKVIILGAGVSGLTAAAQLSERGFSVMVIEKESQVGGLAASLKYKGGIFDYGPHQLRTPHLQVEELIKNLIGQDLLINQKRAAHRFADRLLNYPLGASDILLNLPWRISLSCFGDFLKVSLRNIFYQPTDNSFEEWVINRFGQKMYQVYFGPYTQKTWGLHPSKLAASCAAQRIAVENLWDVLVKAIFGRLAVSKKHAYLPHSPYQKNFYYPKKGIGQISEKLLEKIQAKGGLVYCHSQVQEIQLTGQKAKEVVFRKDNQLTSLKGDYIISTIPLPELIFSLRPQPSPAILDQAKELNFRALVLVNLIVKKKQVTPYHWIYCPENFLIFSRITEYSNFSPYLAPPGQSLICLEITCDAQDKIWRTSDKEIFNQALQGLERIKLLKPNEIESYFVARTRYAYPTHQKGYEEKVNCLLKFIQDIPNLFTLGRQGLFAYINIDICMKQAMEIAEKIIQKED